MDREVLARVGLDFQAQRKWRRVLGVEAVDERDTALGLFVSRLAEPRIQSVAQRVHHRACRLRLRLDKIDVLRISRRRQMQLVQRRAAAKGEGIVQNGMREDLDEGAADDEILLDLDVLRPRRTRAPLEDVVARDHRSGSTSALT